MKKQGFTIAETLITMAIIGVVVALSIPTFVASYRKQVFANTLATAVSNFETAMSAMIIKDGVDDILDTATWINTSLALTSESDDAMILRFISDIGKTLPIVNYSTNEMVYKPLDNTSSEDELTFGSPVILKSKNGIEYHVSISNVARNLAKNEEAMLASNCNYINKAADVGIDLNGEKGPNILGRDFFRFELSTDGRLYPFGGRDYCIYNDVSYEDVKEKCVDDLDGNYCAAYLMQNNYKMDY